MAVLSKPRILEQLPEDVIRELSTHLPLKDYQKFRLSARTFANVLDAPLTFSRFCPLFSAAKSCGIDFACDLICAQKDRQHWALQLDTSPESLPRYYPKSRRTLVTWTQQAVDTENVNMLIWCLEVVRLYDNEGFAALWASVGSRMRRWIDCALQLGWWAGLDLLVNMVVAAGLLSVDTWGSWMAKTVAAAFDGGRSQHALRLMEAVVRVLPDDGWSFKTAFHLWDTLAGSRCRELPLIFLRVLKRVGPLTGSLQALENPCAFLLWADDPSVADEITSLLPGPRVLMHIAGAAFSKSYPKVAFHVVDQLSHHPGEFVDIFNNVELGELDIMEGKALEDAKRQCDIGLVLVINQCLDGHRVALQTLLDAFPVLAPDAVRRIDEDRNIRRQLCHFHRVLPILLEIGWRPKSIPAWLEKSIAVLLRSGETDQRWEKVVGTVVALSRSGVTFEDPEKPLMNLVLEHMMSRPPTDRKEVIVDLIDAGVGVNKSAVGLALRGNMFELLGPLGDKLKAAA